MSENNKIIDLTQSTIRGVAERLAKLEHKANGASPITMADVTKAIQDFANQFANEIYNPMIDDFEKLEARVKKLENDNTSLHTRMNAIVMQYERQVRAANFHADFGYVGTWESGRTYQKGNFVTHAGSLWACQETTKAKPGSGEDDGWQLCVKRGAFSA